MIPNTYKDNNSPGEKELFNKLRDDEATDTWIVFHSVDIRQHIYKKEGEADFIVLIPDMGILCIEVKAAKSITRSSGKWYYGENPEPDPFGPFNQIKEARESFRRYLIKKNSNLGRIPCFSLVIFSHCIFEVTDVGIERKDYLNRKQLHSASISNLLISIMSANLDEFDKKYHWFNRDLCHLSSEDIKQIIRSVRSDFDVTMSQDDRANEIDNEIKKFTDQQFNVIDAIDDNPRVLVRGAAGTGKTFIGIEACRRAASAGKSVLFLCYNQALGQMINDMFKHLNSVWAGTIHGYMIKVSNLNVNNKKNKQFWENHLPEAAFDAVDVPTIDYIIIDEAQDILSENYLLFLSACLKGSLSEGHWLMLGDFCNQNIYGKNNPDLLENYGRFTSATLRQNCRNTPRIVEALKQICELDENIYTSTLRADNMENPTWKHYSSNQEQINILTAVLKKQKKKYPNNKIVILSPNANGCASKISGSLRKDLSTDPKKPRSIYYTTIQKFKGLEAQSIILTDINAFIGNDEKLFYVGASRATSELTIIYHESAKQQLRKLIQN